MTGFRVLLEVRRNGSPCGTVETVVEANNDVEAEAEAVRRWSEVQPDRTFAPLLTVERALSVTFTQHQHADDKGMTRPWNPKACWSSFEHFKE